VKAATQSDRSGEPMPGGSCFSGTRGCCTLLQWCVALGGLLSRDDAGASLCLEASASEVEGPARCAAWCVALGVPLNCDGTGASLCLEAAASEGQGQQALLRRRWRRKAKGRHSDSLRSAITTSNGQGGAPIASFRRTSREDNEGRGPTSPLLHHQLQQRQQQERPR